MLFVCVTANAEVAWLGHEAESTTGRLLQKVYSPVTMRAWLEEHVITIEGTPEEWRGFLERLLVAYQRYPTERFMREFMDNLKKEYPPREEKPTARNWMPDLEWYDKH
jgi:hypothetical protein